MMQHEFEALTKMAVTPSEYADIEERYMAFDGDKKAFAADFLKNDGPASIYAERAREVAHLRSELAEQGKAHRREVEALREQLAKVKMELDRELEWKPAQGCGTNMKQEDYAKLLECCTDGCGDQKVLSDQEAIQLVAEEFGFRPETITIIERADSYDVNKHRRLRLAKSYTRRPCYNATDWNYVRFNVRVAGGMMTWEMVNGQLLPYNS